MSVGDPERKIDSLNIFTDTVTSGGFNTILADGATVQLTEYFTSEFIRDELLNVAMRLRVDVDDVDHEYPFAASMTGTLRAVEIHGPTWNDDAENDNPKGVRTVITVLKNFSGASRTYYTRNKVYKMRQGGSL